MFNFTMQFRLMLVAFVSAMAGSSLVAAHVVDEVVEGSSLIQGKSAVANAGAADVSLPDELATLADDFAEAVKMKPVYAPQVKGADAATEKGWSWYTTVIVDLVVVAFTGYLFSQGRDKSEKVSNSQEVTVAPVATKALEEDSRDEWGCSRLHTAAASGSVAEVRSLLEQGLDMDAREAWDETPLHLAARSGFDEVCKILLRHGATIDAVNASDETPLLVAAQAGKEAACRVLLSSGGTTGGLPDSELPPLLSALLLESIFPGQ